MIFGHFGDRVGRKGVLIATLLMSGLACFAVGFVPTYACIGIWGAVLLTIIRFIQGVGVGGEWGGSVALSMEWARTNAHRGFITSWPQLGVSAGFFLANLAGLVFSAVSGDQFLVSGWRIPFFLSILMVCVGLYIRLGILETPPFRRLLAENRIERVPALEAIMREPKSIILTACARMGEQAPGYIYGAFVLLGERFERKLHELREPDNLLTFVSSPLIDGSFRWNSLAQKVEGSKMYESQVEREGDDRRPDFLCFLISAGSKQG